MTSNILTGCVLLTLSLECVLADSSFLTNIKFYTRFDLTNPVNHYIEHQDFESKNFIKHALNLSNWVYYKTDLLLNNIMEIQPVIDTLIGLQPDEDSRVKIALALPYMRNNTFIIGRLADAFYDLSLNITTESWKAAFSQVDQIILDYSVDKCDEMGGGIPSYDFSKFIRNFNTYYCTSSAHQYGSTPCYKRVGIATNFQQNITCMPPSNKDNHNVTTLKLPSYDNFPIVPALLIKHLSDRGAPLLYLTVEDKPDVVDVIIRWPSQLQQVVASSVHHRKTINSLIRRTYEKVLELSVYSVYGDNCGGKACPFVWYGTEITKHFVNEIANPSQRKKLKNIIPFVSGDETCVYNLVLKINTTGADDRSFFTHHAWRAMARELSELRTPILSSSGTSDEPTYFVENHVHLVFDSGVQKEWPILGQAFRNLILMYPRIRNATVISLIFHEADLTTLNGEPYQPIINFLQENEESYLIGCHIELDKRGLDDLGYAHSSFHAYVSQLCNPIFNQTKIMVWQVPKTKPKSFQYSGALDHLIILKELFLHEYPDIKIYLKFDASEARLEVENWASFYNISVIYEAQNRNDNRYLVSRWERTWEIHE